MLTQICNHLKNWFVDEQPIYHEVFKIEDGELNIADRIQMNQYYWIRGSVFNNGVHKRGSEELKDEVFDGSVQLMAVPQDVIDLASEIEEWQTKYGGVDSANMSPFSSENFAGVYSYSKSSGGSSSSDSSVSTWQSVFADRLRRYRKI